jgi:hypothetical protein
MRRQVYLCLACHYYCIIFGGKARAACIPSPNRRSPLISQPKRKPNPARRIGRSPQLTRFNHPISPFGKDRLRSHQPLNHYGTEVLSKHAHRSPGAGSDVHWPWPWRCLASELSHACETASVYLKWLDRDLTESSPCEYVLHLVLIF